MTLERFFDQAARARVADAVKAAEARTSGQIVPVVVERSGRYGLLSSALTSSFLFTLLMLGLVVFFPALGITPLFVLCSAPVMAVMLVGLAWLPPVARLLVGAHLEAVVRQRALLAFVEHGVYRTREENGVLLFASIYERKVVVLGDRAVHERLGDEHWKRAVATLVAGIRAGDPAEGFCKAIADIGEEMAKAFPRGAAAQTNELSDELQMDR